MKKFEKVTIVILIIILISIVETLMANLILSDSVSTFISSINNYPILYALDFSIILLMISLLVLLFGLNIGISLSIIISIALPYINKIKINMRSCPLIPEDVFLFKESIDIAAKFTSIWTIVLLIGIIVGIIIFYMILRKFTMSKDIGNYPIMFLIIAIILSTSIYRVSSIIPYETNFIFSFATYYLNNNLDEYVEYKEDIDLRLDHGEYKISDLKPNIIVIMSESFWNPNLLNGVRFNKNPIANLEELQKESIYGYMESPEFGGGTSNVEFELLTGYSTHFYKSGYLLYPMKLKNQKVPSLPSYLKTQGYSTTAIHTYNGWYYNRNQVYKLMGFDKFISADIIDSNKVKGLYIGDEYMTDLILDEINKSREDKSFIFAVTMQNHGPYSDNRYSIYNDRIRVQNDLPYKQRQLLETYAQGVYDADKALNRLVKSIRACEEPTMILFFGDHLPILGEDLDLYKKYGFYNKSEPMCYVKLFSVPFILWSNFKSESHNIGLIDTTFMTPYLIKYGELSLNPYYKFLDGLYSQISVISRSYLIDKQGSLIKKGSDIYNKYDDLYKKHQMMEMNTYK